MASTDGKMAPHNVRSAKDLNDRKTADIEEALKRKNFFSDRDHILINQSINDDDYVIPNSLESDSEYVISSRMKLYLTRKYLLRGYCLAL